ncbi:hypothetical protein KCU95_g6757, partial [Aureobasidium melanogenum]
MEPANEDSERTKASGVKANTEDLPPSTSSLSMQPHGPETSEDRPQPPPNMTTTIYTARALHRILYNASLAGQDITRIEETYLSDRDSAEDLIQISPQDAPIIQLWGERYSRPERVPGDPLSAESIARAIFLAPHPLNTLQRKSSHLSHETGSLRLAGVDPGIQDTSSLPRTEQNTEPKRKPH